ncbi:HIT family protein [Tateyamaria pelophila]|uniref:HIT family protein n=1 Tax=Tateyamaria pelophila TaxID=328415 RepID=UPI001CC187EF|nr:HIT family protein [Tateyamaria pelophila]
MHDNPPNSTMTKFGHPATVIGETEHWTVLLRPEQVTLGSLVLISREPVSAFGDVSAEGFAGLKPVIDKIEHMLRDMVHYEKINYLMLMMVDNDVHFHVIPRYDGSRTFEEMTVNDAGWPGPPQLAQAVSMDDATTKRLVDALRHHWSDL